jgi:hypothetical protein
MTGSKHIGRSVLVGLLHFDENGHETSFHDLFGVVESVDPEKGILLRLANGDSYTLRPLDLDEYPAQHDWYEMESERRTVDPDYVVSFDIHPPVKK